MRKGKLYKMNRDLKHKIWHDKRAQKIAKNKKKAKSTHRTISSEMVLRGTANPEHRIMRPACTKKVPENFSILNNPEETIDFFDDLANEIKNRKISTEIFIDSENVKDVTVDAIIYLISVMENIRPMSFGVRHTIRGNLPKDGVIRKVYTESGFMSYVESRQGKLPNNTEKMQIVSGYNNDSKVVASVCEFVMDKLDKKKNEVQGLYKVLIELLSNVYHHAYNKKSNMLKKWYIYAEHIDECVRFVVTDTGEGIPNTVSKRMYEHVTRFLKIDASDSDLICSALEGEFRSETKKPYRSNGLAGVKENVENGLFYNFTVMSSKGRCTINNIDKTIEKTNYKNRIEGTIFTFDIK